MLCVGELAGHKLTCLLLDLTPAMQVDGALTDAEASRFVQTAESIGLKHQGSKGSAYGEVTCTARTVDCHVRYQLTLFWVQPNKVLVTACLVGIQGQ